MPAVGAAHRYTFCLEMQQAIMFSERDEATKLLPEHLGNLRQNLLQVSLRIFHRQSMEHVSRIVNPA
jgi:hypothetical protein